MIVQADDLLALSTVVICPTSASAPPASFHPEIDLDGGRARVLCEMVGAVDARGLRRQVAHVDYDDLRAIDDALLLVLGVE